MAKYLAKPCKRQTNFKNQKPPAKPPRKRSVQERLTAISDALTEELLNSLKEDYSIQERGIAMNNDCENLYKVCRISAGLTQEQAAEVLAIVPRTFSDYEDERARVPDDIVAKMAEAYNVPLIVYYHLRRFSPLGKYLPDLQEPQTHGDMAFQAIIARDELGPAVDCIKRLVADGLIDSDEQEEFTNLLLFVIRDFTKESSSAANLATIADVT